MPTFHDIEAPWWNDAPILIIGSGPSVKGKDLGALRGLGNVIAVKAAMFELSWANCGFGVDLPRLREWENRVADLPFPVYWGLEESMNLHDIDNVKYIKRLRDESHSSDLSLINCGGTSGFGALDFAIKKLGPVKKNSEIYMFGFDYGVDAGGSWHANPCHYSIKRKQNPDNWRSWASRFEAIAKTASEYGISVYNVGLNSNIDAFIKVSYESAVKYLTQRRYGIGFDEGDT